MIKGAVIVRDLMMSTTRITIEITEEQEMNCPRAPMHAAFGDDWICLQDTDQLMDMGYWPVDPESVAMHLMRAAWVVAHHERAEGEKGRPDSRTAWRDEG